MSLIFKTNLLILVSFFISFLSLLFYTPSSLLLLHPDGSSSKNFKKILSYSIIISLCLALLYFINYLNT